MHYPITDIQANFGINQPIRYQITAKKKIIDTDGRTDGSAARRTDGRTGGWINGRTDGWMDKRMDRRTDGRTDGGTDVAYDNNG